MCLLLLMDLGADCTGIISIGITLHFDVIRIVLELRTVCPLTYELRSPALACVIIVYLYIFGGSILECSRGRDHDRSVCVLCLKCLPLPVVVPLLSSVRSHTMNTPQSPLALPAPDAAVDGVASAPAVGTIDLGARTGQSIALDALGPMVVNTDGVRTLTLVRQNNALTTCPFPHVVLDRHFLASQTGRR